MFLLYNFLLTIFSPIWVPWMLWRSWKRKEKPNWQERLGNLESIPPKKDRPRLWFHAVSVGEVIAARTILREIRRILPKHEIVLSVTTSSGHQTARDGDTTLYDYLIYFPIDVARFQLTAMQRIRPDAVLVMETELWMNQLWAAKTFDARTLLINGRISDRSYPRACKIKGIYRALLQNMDRCLMQTESDAYRIRSLGAKSAEVFGSSKFDQAVEGLDANPEELRRSLGIAADAKIIVIGSTRGDSEQDLVLDAVAALDVQNVVVVHAPRHLETVPSLSDNVRRRFGSVALRSKGETGQYIILDTYGELAKIYALADVAVIGGGFSNLGGQNLVQPLAHGKPVLHGSHMQNFRDIAAAADRSGAAIECPNAESLAQELNALLADPDRRLAMGEAAKTLVSANLGASKRYAEAIAAEVRSINRPPPKPSSR